MSEAQAMQREVVAAMRLHLRSLPQTTDVPFHHEAAPIVAGVLDAVLAREGDFDATDVVKEISQKLAWNRFKANRAWMRLREMLNDEFRATFGIQ